MEDLNGMSIVLFPIILFFCIIYILLPIKLWHMADRIKEMKNESKKQTALLEKLVGQPMPSPRMSYEQRAKAIGDDRGMP